MPVKAQTRQIPSGFTSTAPAAQFWHLNRIMLFDEDGPVFSSAVLNNLDARSAEYAVAFLSALFNPTPDTRMTTPINPFKALVDDGRKSGLWLGHRCLQRGINLRRRFRLAADRRRTPPNDPQHPTSCRRLRCMLS
jgi:hypothetical protein